MAFFGRFKFRIPEGFGYLVLTALFVRLLWLGATRGYDYAVYDRAARAWWAGATPYAILPELQGFVFKYPPWVLPVWIPFGALPPAVSLAAWSLVQGVSLLVVLRWCLRSGVRTRVVWGLAVAFFFLFLEHFVAGQAVLPMLAAGLWGLSAPVRGTSGAWAPVTAALALSSKVFNVWSLAGAWRVLSKRAVLTRGLALVGALFVIGGLPYWTRGMGPWTPIQEWLRAAGSGSMELGANVVRGPQNHSLVNLVMRVLGVPAHHSWADAACGMGFGALGAGYLFWVSRRKATPPGALVSGWMALGLLAHPLGWVHSYVLAFPLCAWNVELALRARGDRRKIHRILAALCVFGVALALPQVIRSENVVPFDRIAAKAWGVVIGLIALSIPSGR